MSRRAFTVRWRRSTRFDVYPQAEPTQSTGVVASGVDDAVRQVANNYPAPIEIVDVREDGVS